MKDEVEKTFFAALKSGDSEAINRAFERVYVTYVKLVAFIVHKYVDDEESVKDVVSDVFVGLFNHADSVKGNIKYYLTASARNAAISRLKKNKAIFTVPLEYADGYESEFIETSSVLADMRRVLEKDEIELILLRLEGYAFREIADMKGMNINTVLTKFRRAVKKYKKETGENA